jgi:hypothetical protein
MLAGYLCAATEQQAQPIRTTDFYLFYLWTRFLPVDGSDPVYQVTLHSFHHSSWDLIQLVFFSGTLLQAPELS